MNILVTGGAGFIGGFLVNKSNYEKYVILSNVPETGFINPIKKKWSVNTKTSIFYKKQTLANCS